MTRLGQHSNTNHLCRLRKIRAYERGSLGNAIHRMLYLFPDIYYRRSQWTESRHIWSCPCRMTQIMFRASQEEWLLEHPRGWLWLTLKAVCWDVKRYRRNEVVAKPDLLSFVLFTLYEAVLFDQATEYQLTIDYFWNQDDWLVQDIPDPGRPAWYLVAPADENRRYAFLAACTYLLVRAMNQRMKDGLVRPQTRGRNLKMRNQRNELSEQHHEVPQWANEVPALEELFVMRKHGKLDVLDGPQDTKADPDFLNKGILKWATDIHFKPTKGLPLWHL